MFISLAVTTSLLSGALDLNQARQMAARNNFTCLLVFGDSSVDPGNNNRMATAIKGNFPPYGEDFFSGHPTGRFSNGRLATDFIAEVIGYTNALPAFLDPNMKKEDLLHGVSFASAASGYDDLTANLSNVLPVSKQLEYFRHYKIHLRQLVGEEKTQEVIKNAIFLMSMGTNDFLQNYYLEPIRSEQFNIQQYQSYLISQMLRDIKEMHKLGARRLVVVSVPPIGCMPIVKTLRGSTKCVESYNNVALSFNTKAKEMLETLKASLGITTTYVDVYDIILKAINNPKQYGIEETSKGCCGTGTIEYGDTCRGATTCADRTKYVFWDAIHPTEKMYKIIADEAVQHVFKS